MDKQTCHLVADIGGTHARLALYDAGGLQRLFRQTLDVSSFATLEKAIHAFLQQACVTNQVDTAVLAVAGPVGSDRVQFTNSRWAFSSSVLQQRFGFRTLKIINDFEAVAWSLDNLPAEAVRPVGDVVSGREGGNRAVLGPGTGLGVAAVVSGKHGQTVLAGEGGHARFAPASAQEREVLGFLANELPVVEREDILSGPGLCRLYRAMLAVCGVNEPLIDDPAVITATAVRSPDSFCARVLNAFCGALGSVAADIALEAGATGGVYIGGGIVPRFAEFFMTSPFREHFQAHAQFGAYLHEIPTFLLATDEVGLLGAAAVLQKILR